MTNSSPMLAMTVAALRAVLGPAAAQTNQPLKSLVRLVIETARALRFALDRRTTVKEVGQSVASLVEPISVHERVVLPAGTRATGRVVTLVSPPGGDFSAHRRVTVQFESIVLPHGRRLEIRTDATEGIERVALKMFGKQETTDRS
jgi:hypothetical protein